MKLLLDVDGVLAPFGRGFPSGPDSLNKASYSSDYRYSSKDYIYYSQLNTSRLAKLASLFELHWCTGWAEGANQVISPLHGLPELPVCPILEYSQEIHWKLNSIEAYIGDEPYAFVDDDITDVGIDYANARTARGIPTLWLPTICHEGLTDAHVRILEGWLRQNTQSLVGKEPSNVVDSIE